MRCHACDVAVGDGQRFCHECGATLAGVTDPTEQVEVVPGSDVVPGADGDIDPAADRTVERDVPDRTLTSETVAPPTHDEPAPTPARPSPQGHRGALPDLARPTPVEEAPEWADPALSGVAADNGPVDDVRGDAVPADAGFRPPDEDEDDAVADGAPVPASSLDSVPWNTEETAVTAHEPTETMSASVAPIGFDSTDPYPPVGLATTSEIPATHSGGLFDGAHDVVTEHFDDTGGFQLRASFVFAFLAMVATLMASIADMIDLRTSVPIDGIAPGIRILEDAGTNLAVGGFIGAALMLLGALVACFGYRWGAGLAGGSGLAVAGWAALTIGLFERPLFDARTTFSTVQGLPPGAVLTTTRGLGWFLLLAVGVLGGIVFLTSLRQAGTGGRRGLNPWIAAVGALGSVVLAAGPLIPLGAAELSSNLGFDTEPRAFFAGRLLQLGLLVVTGVLGFLSVRTYGLGLAAGGMSIVIWMWATTLAALGSAPVGPALGNLGTSDTTPHAVTTVGVAVSVLMLAIAITIAAVTRPRPA